MALWSEVRTLFEVEDSGLNLYVLETSIHDWQRLLNAFKEGDFELYLMREGVPFSTPPRVEEIFESRAKQHVVLSIYRDGIWINCQFLSPSEVELDIDPQDITDQESL